MADSHRIRTPLAQHWRRVRYQLVPILTFCLAAAAAFWLWGQQSGRAFAVGEVEAARIDLTAPGNGMLVAAGVNRWELFQVVHRGQLIARLDDRELKAVLATHQKRIIALQKELAATEAKLQMEFLQLARDDASFGFEQIQRLRRMELDVETARLEILDREGRIAADSLELSLLKERLAQIDQLVKDGVETAASRDAFKRTHDVLEKQTAGNKAALAEAKVLLAEAKRRAETMNKPPELPAFKPAAMETYLAPVRAGIAIEEAEMKGVNLEIESLEIRAPFDGMVRDIFRGPGQTVRRGEPILTIVSDQTEHVISYVRQHHRVGPQVGMSVDMRVRTLPVRTVKGKVKEIGPQVVRVPRQHLSDPQVDEWGLPVRIAIAEGGGLRAGEMVDITFKPNYKP
jgi:multidrug resistance efflux pump